MRRRVALLMLGVAALLAGCAGAGSPGAGTSSPPSATPPPSTTPPGSSGAPTAELQIVVHAPGQPEQRWTLRCSGATPLEGSTHPTAGAACELIAARHEILFPPTPSPERACSMLYGGPDVATVAGTDDGAPVARRFTRTNGCETADWNAAIPLIGPPSGAL